MKIEEMAVGNFREFGAKCLHLESPLRKIRAKEGNSQALRVLRKLVACYPLLQRGLDSEDEGTHIEMSGKGRGGWGEEDARRENEA